VEYFRFILKEMEKFILDIKEEFRGKKISSVLRDKDSAFFLLIDPLICSGILAVAIMPPDNAIQAPVIFVSS
jgi:hypothetical protein